MLVLILALSGLASLVVGTYAWQRRSSAGTRWFAWLMASGAGWSLAYAGEAGVTGVAAKVLWAKLQYPFIETLPLLWLFFALEHTGQNTARLRRPAAVGLLGVMPLATLALAATNEAHRLIWNTVELQAGTPMPLRYVYGPWFWANAVWSYALILAGTVVLVRFALGAASAHRSQTLPLVAGAIMPWISNALHISGRSPWPGVDLTSLAFSASGLGFAWSLLRRGLFDVVPVARSTVFESMSDGVIVLDRGGHLVDLNPAAVRILGGGAERRIGAPGGELGAAWEPALQADAELARRFEITLPDGRALDVHAAPVRRRDGVLSGRLLLVTDVSEARDTQRALRASHSDLERTEAAFRASEERYRVLFDHNPFPTWVYDSETLRIVAVNRAAVEHYGFSKDEFLALTIVDIRPPEDVPWLLAALRTNPPGERTVSHSRHRKKDGTEFEAEVVVRAITFADRPAALVVAVDVTERRRAERLKAEFVATVSHELRTPLSAVRGALGLLTLGALDDHEGREAIALAERNSVRLARLIDDLLDFSRLESGALVLHAARVSAASLLRRAADAMAGMAAGSGIALEVREAPGVAFADPDRIQQVLVNLLSNALKFSAAGTVVGLSAVDGTQWVELRVADQGRGVPADLHQAIFERFRQVDSSDSREKGGAGLGLAICKGIVEAHGGSIGVESAPGQGSTFWFRLPVPATREGVSPRP